METGRTEEMGDDIGSWDMGDMKGTVSGLRER
jgi:hypothetical protein